MPRSRSLAMAKRAQRGQKAKTQQVKKRSRPAPATPANIKAYPLVRLDVLLSRAREPVITALSQLPSRAARVLFLSFTAGEERARVINIRSASPEGAWEALEQAVAQQNLKGKKVRLARVDWVDSAQTHPWRQVKARLLGTRRNYYRYGLSLDSAFQYPLLEQELNANALLYGGGEINHASFNAGNVLRYTRERFGKGLPEPDSNQTVIVFTTAALLLEANGDPVPLNGYTGGTEGRDTGRRRVPELDKGQVNNLISQSSQFLAEQVNPQGRFVYGRHPCFDREINTYNTLRHASTTYAMLEAWEVTGEKGLRQAIDRSIACLTSELIRIYTDGQGDQLAYLVEANHEIKLGGNAVCLLALVKYTELTGDEQYLPLLEQLALGIVRMQNPDTGQFVHVLNAADLSVKEPFRIIYYDGEAAFGLIRLYGLTNDERWLTAVVRAFDYFIEQNHWQSHDHWLSYCVNELTLYRPEERYYRFGIQNVAGHLDFVIDRITTFPTLLELMMAAHKMITRLQGSKEHRHLLDQFDLDKFYLALEARARYLLNGFFWPEFAMFFKNPQSILGSFFIRHHGFRVRIDDVEHYLSGFVAYLLHYLPAPYPVDPARLDERPNSSLERFQQSLEGPSEAAGSPYWTQSHVSLATPGEWVSHPGSHWHATGLSFTTLSVEPGHMVVIRSPEGGRGVPVQRVKQLRRVPSALIVPTPRPEGIPEGIPCYQVPSVENAILDFGRYARAHFTGKVVGVTGSAGKTSSVKLLQKLLGRWGETGASRLSGNLPHGVAWNLASMKWRSPFQVVEMAIGRMSVSSGIVRPDVAVFLNVGPAHLEYHKTTEQVAIKKSRIFDAMEPGQYAVINRDMDEWPIVRHAAESRKLRILSFGTHEESDFRWMNPGARVGPGGAILRAGATELTLPLMEQGAHVVMNVLAAIGVLSALDLPYQEIIDDLARIEPAEGRGEEWQQEFGPGQLTFLDDAYNANPLSMKVMLEQVAERSVAGGKHLILGDMLELGEDVARYHRDMVRPLCVSGAASVTLFGEHMHNLAHELEGCIPEVLCAHDYDQTRILLSTMFRSGDLIVAKGSNRFKLSQFLKSLQYLSYIVVDGACNTIMDYQSELKMRPGSLVKLVTAMVVLDNRHELSQMLTVKACDLVGGSGANLESGDQLSMHDALRNLLIPSSNRSAQLLARSVGEGLDQRPGEEGDPVARFVDAMNRKAQTLGAVASRFTNPSGLGHPDMYSTAQDIMRISQAAMEYPVIRSILARQSDVLSITGQRPRALAIRTRMEPLELSNGEVVYGKTGTLIGAAENVMIHARTNGEPVTAVVMQNGGDRWQLIKELLSRAGQKTTAAQP